MSKYSKISSIRAWELEVNEEAVFVENDKPVARKVVKIEEDAVSGGRLLITFDDKSTMCPLPGDVVYVLY